MDNEINEDQTESDFFEKDEVNISDNEEGDNLSSELEAKNKKMKIAIIVISIITISLITVVIIGGFYINSMNSSKTDKLPDSKVISNKVDNTDLVEIEENSIDYSLVEESDPLEIIEGFESAIGKGSIVWQEPEDLGDLGLTTPQAYKGTLVNEIACGKYYASKGIKYVKVGEVTDGQYSGGNLIVVFSWVYEGMGFNPDVYRIIEKDNSYFVLANLIDEYNQEPNVMMNNKSILANCFSFGNKVLIDEETIIEELQYPKELYGNKRQKLVKNKYNEAFFTEAKLKKAFNHSDFGQAWMTDDSKKKGYEEPIPFELNSFWERTNESKELVKNYRDIFEGDGFYLKAPDGTAVSYRAEYDIFEDMFFENGEFKGEGILEATWNNGEKNKSEYEIEPRGCGLSSYAYNKTAKIDIEKDLRPAGKTSQGDIIYGYRSVDHPDFVKLYEDVYWPGDGEEKKSKEEYLEMNAEIFWVDPFGRTLSFYKTDLISPAECGKPVVYLYPEEETQVSIKVKPARGISISDPDYGDGWNVVATSSGELTNLADGNTYPYLFWEGAGDVPYKTPNTGFVVARDDLKTVLDEKLTQLGMISTEINDFEEFWLPEMLKENKPYFFITFLSQRFIDQTAPLEITPTPDTVIRVMMDYEALDEYKKVPELRINTPKRKGFTVVEWGGMLK